MATTRTRGAGVITGLALLAATACSGGSADPPPTDGETGTAGSPTSAATAPSSSTPSPTPTEPASSAPPATATPEAAPARGSVSVERTVIGDRNVPWGLAQLPGGDVIYTSRDRYRVHRLDPESGDQTLLGTIDEAVAAGGEGGLLGVAVPPDFDQSAQLYLYYTTDSDNRIVRMDYDESRPATEQLSAPEVIVDGIPSGFVHNGGRIAFGPDGMLYASTGEAGQPELAQDQESLGGKILRMTPDGDPAPGNPDPDSPIFTSGHRNVQGLAWDDAGRLWASEFGSDTFDELNLIEAGNNYGWPDAEGRDDNDDYTDPVAQWGTDEDSPSGIAYAGGSIWMAALQGERLWRIPLDGTEPVADPQAFLVGEYGRLRSVLAVDDDTLLVTTSNTDRRGAPADDDDRILELTVR